MNKTKSALLQIASILIAFGLGSGMTYDYLTKHNKGTMNLQRIGFQQCVDMDQGRTALRVKVRMDQLRNDIQNEFDETMASLNNIDPTPIPSKSAWLKRKRKKRASGGR